MFNPREFFHANSTTAAAPTPRLTADSLLDSLEALKRMRAEFDRLDFVSLLEDSPDEEFSPTFFKSPRRKPLFLGDLRATVRVVVSNTVDSWFVGRIGRDLVVGKLALEFFKQADLKAHDINKQFRAYRHRWELHNIHAPLANRLRRRRTRGEGGCR